MPQSGSCWVHWEAQWLTAAPSPLGIGDLRHRQISLLRSGKPWVTPVSTRCGVWIRLLFECSEVHKYGHMTTGHSVETQENLYKRAHALSSHALTYVALKWGCRSPAAAERISASTELSRRPALMSRASLPARQTKSEVATPTLTVPPCMRDFLA